MKTPCFILTIIGFIAFISCNNESESSFATRKGYSRNENLKGDIASVIVSHYNLENKFGEEQQGELKIEEQFIFNDAGNVIEEITYNPNGNPGYKYSTVKRVYNEKNDLIKKIEHSEDTTYKKETRYLYDSKGKRIEERSSDYFIVSTGEYIETLNYVKKHNYNSLGKISEIS